MSTLSGSSFSSVSQMSCFKKGNQVLLGQVRLPSYLINKAHKASFIRCEAVSAPSLVNGGLPSTIVTPSKETLPPIRRSDFPADFVFGASSSAIQTEGPPDIGGRGPSTWDFMITTGTEFKKHPNVHVASLSYELYKEDVKLLKNMGADVYRFSISWSRILPNGKGEINQAGIDFYHNLIDELIMNGIKPCITLFHFDLPSGLQKEYNGFLDRQIVKDFTDYCDICFREFGKKVKFWTTINEPNVFAQYTYTSQISITDKPNEFPYIVAHNIILSHASAVRLYKEKYQAEQKGEIGITVSTLWSKPYSDMVVDKDAASRAFAFMVGWFLEPLVHGDYPFIMRAVVDERLPYFTADEIEMIKGAYDFIGINYYTARYAQGVPFHKGTLPKTYADDTHVTSTVSNEDGKYIGHPFKESTDQFVVPEGLRDILMYMKDNYENPKIYITENGLADHSSISTLKEALDDHHRIVFIRRHLKAVLEAQRAGVNVKGYFYWSLMDGMEPGSGYAVRMGLNYTDYEDKLKRRPKKSALWFKEFLKQKN